MKTRYIYTEKAEQLARDAGLQEYRKAGTAAHFGYKPLEESPITRKAWIEAGYIEEVEKPVNALTFTFTSTANSHMTRLFKENGINYKLDMFFESLIADINQDGQPVKVDYYHIGRDEKTGLNLFEIREKEPRKEIMVNFHDEEVEIIEQPDGSAIATLEGEAPRTFKNFDYALDKLYAAGWRF